MAHSAIWLAVLNSKKGQKRQANDSSSLFPTREMNLINETMMTEVPCIIMIYLELSRNSQANERCNIDSVFTGSSLLLCTRRVQRDCSAPQWKKERPELGKEGSLRNALLFKLLFNSTGEQSSS